jgi:hypothetical protein
MAIDSKKKSDKASRNPCVQRASRTMRTEGTIGVIGGFLRVNEMPRSEILATNAATEMAVKMNEKMKM